MDVSKDFDFSESGLPKPLATVGVAQWDREWRGHDDRDGGVEYFQEHIKVVFALYSKCGMVKMTMHPGASG